MHLDPIILTLCTIAAVVIVIGIVLRRFKQPHVVAYILTGVLFGPGALDVVTDDATMNRIGSIGVVLLLFFVGMEIDLRGLIERWRIAIAGTILQVGLSVVVVWLLGTMMAWPLPRIVLLGFVISLSSTAVVLKLLKDSNESQTHVGKCVTGILLIQDLVLVPMLIILGLFGADRPGVNELALQSVGGIGLLALVVWTKRRGGLPPLVTGVFQIKDEEFRVLGALLLCFGLAALTGLLGLSTALGAFVAGILIGTSSGTEWIQSVLAPFRVVLVGAFFISVGMLIDLRFLQNHWQSACLLLAAVFLINTVINAVVLRALGDAWRDGLYAAALLAQIGELSFVLAAVGYQAKIITSFAYQLTVITIALSLTLSPAWITFIKRVTGHVVRSSVSPRPSV